MKVLEHAIAFRQILHTLAVLSFFLFLTPGSSYSYSTYDIGFPTLSDIWVDPLNGNDTNIGSGRADAVRTVAEAWNRIPQSVTLSSTGYRIRLVGGDYPSYTLPGWMESRLGTYQYPVIFEAADGPHSVRFHGKRLINCIYR